MEKLASLTKENFWNYLTKKDPIQMKKFCNWIDKYKKEIHWNALFNDPGSPPVAKHLYKPIYAAPKYHDLPLAMQLGIFIQFCFEQGINATVFLGDTGAMIDSMEEIPKAISMCLHDWNPEIFKTTTVEDMSMDDETEGMAFI